MEMWMYLYGKCTYILSNTRQVKNEKIVFVNNMWMCKIISNVKINMKFLFSMVLKEFQKALILSFLTNSQLLRIPEIALFREFNYLILCIYQSFYDFGIMIPSFLRMAVVLFFHLGRIFLSSSWTKAATEMFKDWFWKLKILCLVHLVTATSVVLIWKKN